MRHTLIRLIAFCLVFIAPVSALAESDVPVSQLIVFVAKKIITMEHSVPTARAVAVTDGKIVAVGTLDSLNGWIEEKGAYIDRRFENDVIMPGFIDPHVHPSLPAILTQFPFIAPDDWSLPTGEFPAAKSRQDYLEKLHGYVKAHGNSGVPFVTWGYHPLWHGEIYRNDLNALFPDQPVILWHRSFHELIGNDAAFRMLSVTEADVSGKAGVDWEKGHFWENGALILVKKMPFIFDQSRYEKGLGNFLAMLRQAGVTTALDMGTGIFGNAAAEAALIGKIAKNKRIPARILLTPIITDFLQRGVSIPDALKEVSEWNNSNSSQVMFTRHFKLMLDGAIYSGLAQFGFPGYKDGHEGVWMVPLETTLKWAQAFWNQGYQIHAHANGDLSTERLINIVRHLQNEKPRLDHRTTLEHFAYATEDQIHQLKVLGILVSGNPYYQYMLSDLYADAWLGEDRARKMVPFGSVERSGAPFAFHSDCPMAPLNPLVLVSTAVNRVTINGNENIISERVSLDAALRAITINAAWILGWENEIGSLRAGKRADMVVLDQDPYKVKPEKLKDIRVLATIFEGEAVY